MAKPATAKKATVSKISKAKSANRPLADIATTTPKVNAGGLDLEAYLKNNPENTARAAHNQDRHTDLDGMTVREALATRRVDARDIRYDIQKGFMTIHT